MQINKYAILIDAGFLKRKLGTQDDPVTSDRIIRFINSVIDSETLKNNQLYRIYYYDAPPLDSEKIKPLTNKEKVNFSASDVSQINIEILSELKRQDFYSLRLGECIFRGWSVKPQKIKGTDSVTITADDIVPNINQKGVDMRIGLDIASLTLKQHVDRIVLVTGDSDFVPAMKFARREGAQLIVIHLDHGIKEDLLEHSDLVLTPNLPDDLANIIKKNTRKRRR